MIQFTTKRDGTTYTKHEMYTAIMNAKPLSRTYIVGEYTDHLGQTISVAGWAPDVIEQVAPAHEFGTYCECPDCGPEPDDYPVINRHGELVRDSLYRFTK